MATIEIKHDGKRWIVTEGATEICRFDRKRDAIAAGRKAAREAGGGELHIHTFQGELIDETRVPATA